MERTFRILVVEDNPTTLKMLRVVLEGEGFQVVPALDARSALNFAAEQVPDLVLQDLILPDMNGFELIRQLRAIPGAADIPILAVSGFLGLVDGQRSVDAGFTDILVKPVEPLRLVETVRSYLPAPPPPEPAASKHRLLLVDDDLIQLKLARIHFTQLGFEVTTAASGDDAVRAARASRPDVILSDVIMPESDGFELCLELRRDTLLLGIPVVLLSAQEPTPLDKELATRVGANALVPRTPGFPEAMAAVLEAIRTGAPREVQRPGLDLQLEHAHVVIQRLERQVAVAAGLARRCTFQAAQLSLLSGVADALARDADPDVALGDVLTSTLDAAGISKGAFLLRQAGGTLLVRHSIGFSDAEREALPSFFGHAVLLESAVSRGAALSIPSPFIPTAQAEAITGRAGSTSVHIVPLMSEGRGVGAIVFAARRTDVTSEDALAFARAMGNQLVQSLELASAFSRVAASEARYRALLQSASDPIAVLTADGRIEEVNRSWEAIVGKPERELVGRKVSEFLLHDRDDGAPASIERWGPVPESRRYGPVEIQKPDGSTVLLEFSNTALELDGKRLVFAVGRDVTAKRRAQEQLFISDRMATVGTLAAAVAHEVNNPLAAVTGNLELAEKALDTLLRKQEGPSPLSSLREVVGDAREAAERVRGIVGDLRVLSRAENDERAPVDIHRVLDSSLRIADGEIRHRAAIIKDYGKIPYVLGNESRLGQVFLNLLVNAAQAIAEGHADRNRIHVCTRYDESRGRVVIEVRDTGSGIPPHVLRRLFSPFFTTKPAETGTGLGLAICKRIVTGFGGEIDVDSTVGKGTVFRVALPSTLDAPVLPSAIPGSAPSARRGRILVVDDEPMIGKLVTRCLSPEHDVVVMSDAAAALAEITAGRRFDVILCDLMMPVITGVELHAALMSAAPGQAERMIFLSGGAFTAATRSFLAEVPNARLDKPFQVGALRALVNDSLR